ncbi:chromo' (CHRromatin Organization MOdifier) domain protein [Dictyocaulus viviparus]|uniref:Chromo' (CHRromatin Organization MOdifier) domain protein n=1 Tax=Dictyocaulus viviparus TaxID=29172 RepID=A0A0D8XBE6_DICVI|nr:chromo' (CHRromatin Organization MOdifier) domain protein [Dictyocaulus viviparus]
MSGDQNETNMDCEENVGLQSGSIECSNEIEHVPDSNEQHDKKDITSVAESCVHVGDAGLEDEDEEMDDEEAESEGDEVESIEDIKIQNGVFKYRVRWVGCKPSEDTWEPEESFTGSESKALLEEYREAHKEKVEELLKAEKAKKGRRTKRGPRWEYVSEIVTREDKTGLKPRELQASDVFYGQPASELASASSELKKLFDPSHKNSATELFLTTTDPSVKVTRSQTKALIGSREASRSNTPTLSTKLLTANDTSRGSASPTSTSTKTLRKKSMTSSKRTSKRKAPKQKEEERAPENVIINTSCLVENQVTENSSSLDKPPIVLKLTLKKAEKPGKKEKRSASEKALKEKCNKKEKKLSLNAVPTPVSSQPREVSCVSEKDTKVEEITPPQPVAESKPTTKSTNEFAAGSSPASSEQSPRRDVPTSVRRRALHLLPGQISTDPLTSQTLSNMLRELEIKFYGNDERHPYTQEQFNEAILSGTFMRVRKAMVNNLLTAPRLAMWTNPYGANLLHLLCRSTKCDGKHAGDDIATVLCNIAPTLLSCRDNMGKIPLHDAVDKGQVCRVTRLLTYHSPVNVTDRNGNSPLSLAYSKNHAKMVRILLQAGANFYPLESSERRKSENLRKRRAFDVLTKHSRMISGQMQRARRKVYRLLTEVKTVSPCFTAPFADGPEFTFNWQTRCWGGLRLAQAPLLNGRALEPTSMTDRGDHMIFFITPVNGANTIYIRINENEVPKRVILGAQVVLVKRTVRENWSSSMNHYPPLEQAPMIGPY